MRTTEHCNDCGKGALLVDEHVRCEPCVYAAGAREDALWDVKEHLDQALERGLSAAQIREAVDMHLSDRTGPLAGAGVKRLADGDWCVDPPSAFLADEDDETPTPNRIGTLGGTLECLAARLDVDPREVALWRQGVTPPRWAAQAMGEMFCLSVAWLLKCESDTCARCRREAPGSREARDDEGWTVARGNEFVCAGCLAPGDLDW